MSNLELIQWVDCLSDDGWLSVDEADHQTLATAYTVGFIVKDEPDFLTVAGSFNTYEGAVNQYGAVWTIPKVAIQSRTQLKLASKPTEVDGS